MIESEMRGLQSARRAKSIYWKRLWSSEMTGELSRLLELALADRFPGLITYEFRYTTYTYEPSAVISSQVAEIFIKICPFCWGKYCMHDSENIAELVQRCGIIYGNRYWFLKKEQVLLSYEAIVWISTTCFAPALGNCVHQLRTSVKKTPVPPSETRS